MRLYTRSRFSRPGNLHLVPLLCLSLLMASCATQDETAPESLAADPFQAPLDLDAGGAWRLGSIVSMDDSIFRPEPGSHYLLLMYPDGRLQVQSRCLDVSGTWRHTEAGGLRFEKLTHQSSPETPDCVGLGLNRRLLTDLGFVRSFVFRDQKLYLATMADGAILEFSASPEFDCSDPTGTVTETICRQAELSLLDRKLNRLFTRALDRVSTDEQARMRAFQRGWIKGRDDCWKSVSLVDCIRQAYGQRITELQIASAAVTIPRPWLAWCDGGARLQLYFYRETWLPALVLNDDQEQTILLGQPAASGSKYAGGNIEFREKGGEAMYTRSGADPQQCRVTRRTSLE